MAASCHLNAEGLRFSDGTWGVLRGIKFGFCGGRSELSPGAQRFAAATKQLPLEVDMHSYVAHVDKPMNDLRPKSWRALHDPDSYAASQAMDRKLRAQQSWGIVYNSVSEPGGQCVEVLRLQGIAMPVMPGVHVSLCWDGQRIKSWYRKSEITRLKQYGLKRSESSKK